MMPKTRLRSVSRTGPQPAAQGLLTGPDIGRVTTTAVEDDRGHGRVERRTIRVAPADITLFPGATQAFRLRCDVGGLDGVTEHKEIVYGITSLPADLAGPVHLNHYQRRHRVVENRLHWVRDCTRHEDGSDYRECPRGDADRNPTPSVAERHRRVAVCVDRSSTQSRCRPARCLAADSGLGSRHRRSGLVQGYARPAR